MIGSRLYNSQLKAWMRAFGSQTEARKRIDDIPHMEIGRQSRDRLLRWAFPDYDKVVHTHEVEKARAAVAAAEERLTRAKRRLELLLKDRG